VKLARRRRSTYEDTLYRSLWIFDGMAEIVAANVAHASLHHHHHHGHEQAHAHSQGEPASGGSVFLVSALRRTAAGAALLAILWLALAWLLLA
jgi:hypothetical protein